MRAKQQIRQFQQDAYEALPVIVYFIACFLLCFHLLGVQHTLIAGVVPTIFKNTLQKEQNNFWDTTFLFVLGCSLIVGAYIGTLNPFLCLALNFIVPFVLTIRTSSQKNPMGYYAYSMLFVWLSIMPPKNPYGLLLELVSFLICVILLIVGVCSMRLLQVTQFEKNPRPSDILRRLSELLMLLPQAQDAKPQVAGAQYRKNTKTNSQHTHAQAIRALPDKNGASVDPAKQSGTRQIEEELDRATDTLIKDFGKLPHRHRPFIQYDRPQTQQEIIQIILQRFSYMVGDKHQLTWDAERCAFVAKIAELIRDIANDQARAEVAEQIQTTTAKRIWNSMRVYVTRIREDHFSQAKREDAQELYDEGVVSDLTSTDLLRQPSYLARTQELLKASEEKTGRVYIFCRSMLHALLLMLQAPKTLKRSFTNPFRWHIIASLRVIPIVMRSKFFELRFAARIGVVISASIALSWLFPNHGYWIPLNAYILCRPSADDSTHRLRTRMVGSMVACVLLFFIQPLLTTAFSRVISAIIAMSLLNCFRPGSTPQAGFATMYALSLASFSINIDEAIERRLGFLAIAVVVVFVANRFFLPNRDEDLLYTNVRHLINFQRLYWQAIRHRLLHHATSFIAPEILRSYHISYVACQDCLQNARGRMLAQEAFGLTNQELQDLLVDLWHSFAELEQANYLIRLYRNSLENKQMWQQIEQKRVLRVIETFERRLEYMHAVMHTHQKQAAYGQTFLRIWQRKTPAKNISARVSPLISVVPLLEIANPDLNYVMSRYSNTLGHTLASLARVENR